MGLSAHCVPLVALTAVALIAASWFAVIATAVSLLLLEALAEMRILACYPVRMKYLTLGSTQQRVGVLLGLNNPQQYVL